MSQPKIVIIGGGAAGFFAAIHAKEACPKSTVLLFEAKSDVLSKVKISGGGRCNVTHACFDPRELVQFYPRGGKALLGIFSRFQPSDTVAWFESHGVPLKTESDNRMFPQSNTSQSIIDCLLQTAKDLGVKILTKRRVSTVQKRNNQFEISLEGHPQEFADKLILATGSAPIGYKLTESLGHKPIPPLPSLFTMTIKDPQLRKLAGLSVQSATVSLPKNPSQMGPILITHWGLSGPAIIKLSAWAARSAAETNYQFPLTIDWLPEHTQESVQDSLNHYQSANANKKLAAKSPFKEIPSRLWAYFCKNFPTDSIWKNTTTKDLQNLTKKLTNHTLQVVGKSPFKEEFVTAGGIDLKEVDCKTMESRLCPKLHIVGELLNVDGVTGGFNFQNAWSTGYLAGRCQAPGLTKGARVSGQSGSKS